MKEEMHTTFGPASFDEFEDKAIDDPVVLQALARKRRRAVSAPRWLWWLLLVGGVLAIGILVGRFLVP